MSLNEPRRGKKPKKIKRNKPMAEALPSDECSAISGQGTTLPGGEQRDAKLRQILLYVLPKWERQTVVLERHPDHTGGPARSTSVSSISDSALLAQGITLFHARWCA